jgi:hypothetical protein
LVQEVVVNSPSEVTFSRLSEYLQSRDINLSDVFLIPILVPELNLGYMLILRYVKKKAKEV